MLNNLKKELPLKFRDTFTDRRDLIKSNRGKSLYIYGDVGTGKTVFAWSYYLDAKSRGNNAMYLNFADYCRNLRSRYKEGDPYAYAEDIETFQGCLILDDIGAEKSTDFIIESVYMLVNYRYENMLQTLLVSNLSMSTLGKRMNSRIISRLTEMCEIIKFDGKDRRKNENKK